MATQEPGEPHQAPDEATPQTEDSSVSLIDLPPELRLTIYRYIFDSMPKAAAGVKPREVEPTALFAICCTIRSETLPAYDSYANIRLSEASAATEAIVDETLRRPDCNASMSTAQFDAWTAEHERLSAKVMMHMKCG